MKDSSARTVTDTRHEAPRAGRSSGTATPGLAHQHIQPIVIDRGTHGIEFQFLTSVGAAEGAQSTLFAATAAETRPGGYYGPGRLFNIRGSPVETEPSPFARDKNAAKRLFDELERIAGIRYPL